MVARLVTDQYIGAKLRVHSRSIGFYRMWALMMINNHDYRKSRWWIIMTKKSSEIAGMLLCVAILTATASGLPDLTVSGVATGAPSFITPSEANLPLTVTIQNLGDSTSTRFKLSVDVIDSSGRFVKPFTVPGQSDRWYPWKTGQARGASYSFRGTLYIGIPSGPSLHGQRITIIPRVDSCSGDEFMPDYCRVRESNEANNENRRSITLP